jgi:hypothetical protein
MRAGAGSVQQQLGGGSEVLDCQCASAASLLLRLSSLPVLSSLHAQPVRRHSRIHAKSNH